MKRIRPLVDVQLNLRRASVSIIAEQGRGSGFFVAPDLVLTAAHVVKSGGDEDRPADVARINITWTNPETKQRHRLAVTEVVSYERLSSVDGASPISDWPDIALLRVSRDVLATDARPASVTLSAEREVVAGEQLLSYGYPITHVIGRPQEWKVKGVDEWERIVLGEDWADPGLSGAPVYSSKIRAVVGFVTHGGQDRPQASVISLATAQAHCAPLQLLIQQQKPLAIREKDVTHLPRTLAAVKAELETELQHRPWGIQLLRIQKPSQKAVLLLRVMDKDFKRILGQAMSVVERGHVFSELHYYSENDRLRAQSDAVPWAVLRAARSGFVEFVATMDGTVKKKRHQYVVDAYPRTFPFVVTHDGAGIFHIGSAITARGADPTINCFVKKM